MKIITLTIQVVFITLMLGVAGLFLLPLLPIDNNVQLRIVESGSMEPAIMTGSLVVIIPASSYGVGDVVTFRSTAANVPTTHRIIESFTEGGVNYFMTKGDANEEADTASVRVEDVLGKIAIDVPYAGFILDFARQPIGFSLLILLPALMIVFSEIEKIWMEVRNRRKGMVASSYEENEEIENDDGGLTDKSLVLDKVVRMMDISTPVRYKVLPTLDLRNKKPVLERQPTYIAEYKKHFGQWATICLVIVASSIFVSASFLPYTASYFNDVERTIDNALGAIMLDFTVSSESNIFNFLGTGLDSEGSSVVNVVEPENGSADMRYDIDVEYKGGSLLFCGAILADMSVLSTVYSGSLLALMASDVNFAGPWSLVLSLDENVTGYLAEDFCQVDIVYTAWHQAEDSDTGYHDEERVPLTFYAPADVPFARVAPSTELFLLSTENSVPEDETADEVETIIDEEINDDILDIIEDTLVLTDQTESKGDIDAEVQIYVEEPEVKENELEEEVEEEVIEEEEVKEVVVISE